MSTDVLTLPDGRNIYLADLTLTPVPGGWALSTKSGASAFAVADGRYRQLADDVPWAELSGVPTSFNPSAHAASHAAAGSDPLTVDASQIGSGALAKARQHAATAYTDASNVFATEQYIQPSGAAPLLRLVSPSTVGGTGYGGEVRFQDTLSVIGGRLIGNFGGSAAGRGFQFFAQTDRDGNRLPFQMYTHNAAGAATLGLEVLAGANAGKVAVTGAPTSATEVEALAIDNRVSNATGSGSRLAFRTGSTAGTTMGEIAAVLTSTTSADVVMRVRNAGAVQEALRLLANRTVQTAAGLSVGTTLSLPGVATATTVGAAGAAAAMPTPVGYITVNIGGTDRKLAYFNV